LNEIPLGIIAGPDGKLEMEKYDLRLLSSTRDILLSPAPRHEATALLVGDPDFDLSPEKQRAAMQKLDLLNQQVAAVDSALPIMNRDRALPSPSALPRLPGTGAEVSAIAGMMQKQDWKTKVYTGDEALKTIIERTTNARVIHLATHGFFLPDQPIATQQHGDARASRSEAPPFIVGDPMLRSGLYFAGADRALAGNSSPAGLDNGILTALEAGNLDLTGTQLVVLSACNTGQGDVRNGEGVFGLRRALQEAGAQSVLMTLWSVPDKETLDLMQRFYGKWLSGTEVHQALKDAQLEIRQQVKVDHNGKDLPYYWGAFVLVGR
jgi:CHAT domain-containing protein